MGVYVCMGEQEGEWLWEEEREKGEMGKCFRSREYANKLLMHMWWHTLPSGTDVELNPDLYVVVEATVG